MNNKCVKLFLEHLIDYAGLFPPAILPLHKAIINYKNYKESDDSWILGSFVIPASRLDELDPYMHLFSSDQPLTLSAIGSRSRTTYDCKEKLRNDLIQIESFCERHGTRVEIKLFEIPLPPVSFEDDLLDIISMESAKRGLNIFCELTFSLHGDWKRQTIHSLDAIYKHNVKFKSSFGLKLRTGGVTADMFPTPAQIALVLVGCRDRSISMKFTAGLHHPLRMYRDEVGTKMYGFLNLFFAGILAYTHQLDPEQIEEILIDEDAGNFTFTNDSLGWRDLRISSLDIQKLRQVFQSFGSCSFDEPREDLRSLQFL